MLAEPYEALLPPNAGVLAVANDTLLPPNDGALAEPNKELLAPNEGELLDSNVLPETNEGVLPEKKWRNASRSECRSVARTK